MRRRKYTLYYACFSDMTLSKKNKQLLASIDGEWRSKIEENIEPLKKWNQKKRKDCVEKILQILCEAIIDDRRRFSQRFGRFKKYVKTSIELLAGLVLLCSFVCLSFCFLSIVWHSTCVFKTLSKADILRLISDNSVLFLVSAFIFSVVIAIIFVIWLLKSIGAESHIGDALKTFRENLKIFK